MTPEEPFSLHLQTIKDRIAHDAYVVDAQAVAGAVLRRPGALRALGSRQAVAGVTRAGARTRRFAPDAPPR